MLNAALIEQDDPRVALMEELGRFALDPLGYVLFAFPWGKGELAQSSGPRDWQREELTQIGEALRAGRLTTLEAVQRAVVSGHGVGKSALVAMVIKWALDTCVDTRGVVTANTDNQLRTKTWPEVSKWHRLSITRDLFCFEATSLSSVIPGHERNWRIDIIPWSENNPEAFAGLHNKGRRIIVVFDEASGIGDKIWEVTEGALTDEETEILWLVYGNGTRPNGRFRECFRTFRHRWVTRHLDARTVEGTNKTQLDAWIEDRGEDSDFVRVRVRGEFPVQSEEQLIPQDTVAAARKRPAVSSMQDPLVAGLDVGRGIAESVLTFRMGRDARSFGPHHWNIRDSVVLAERVAHTLHATLSPLGLRLHMLFVDGGGVGGPVADMLRAMGWPVVEINFGEQAADPSAYLNKGSEMWGRMGDWIRGGGAIVDDPVLEEQLTSREFSLTRGRKSGLIALVPKDAMRADGLPSPDRADSLALTFAREILPGVRTSVVPARHGRVLHGADENPLANLR